MIPVRQSTAFECALGPVLDADGVAVTDCVVGDFKIKKTTGNFAALNGSATLTHVSAGFYDLVLTTSDVDTVGLATVAIDDTTNACAPLYLQVVEEAVYDALFAASALGYVANAPVNVAQFGGSNGTFSGGRPEVNTTHWGGTAVGSTEVRANLINIAGSAVNSSSAQLGVNVVNFGGSAGTFASGIPAVNATQISGDSTAADNLEAEFDGTGYMVVMDSGTAQAGAASTITLKAGSSGTDDYYDHLMVRITGGSGSGQVRVIDAYNGTTKVATVAPAWGVSPDGTSTYLLLAGSLAHVNEVETGAITSGSFAAGAITAAAIADGAIDAATFAADVDAEILSYLVDDATRIDASALNTLSGHDPGATLGTSTLTQAQVTGGAYALNSASFAFNAALDFTTTQKAATIAGVTTVGSVTGAVGSVTGAVGSVTGNVGGNVTGSIGSLAAQAKADVNAEVLDVLNTDTFAQPGQESPAATTTLQKMIAYLYKAWRNKSTQTSSEYALYADDGSTKDQEAVVSDDGTTFTKGEVSTGA